MSEVAIKVENLTKIYKMYSKPIDRLKESLNPMKRKYHYDHFALNNISFEINKGDIIGIIGKNGSGKSTLLKIITGVLSPTNGSVHVNGKISALLELGAGFNPEYTGIENIYFNGMVMGFTKEEMEQKVDSIIQFADIGDFINQPVKTYSSGMFARLAFAVAINVEPEILIIDETLSVGDMYFQAKCMSKMKELFSKGVTVIFVTHDTNSIKSLCNKTLYLNKGNFVSYGPSEEVVDLYSKATREEMIEHSKTSGGLSLSSVTDVSEFNITSQEFKENVDFKNRVSLYRQGTLEAELTDIEVLDQNDYQVEDAEFNEHIKIRMHIKFNVKCNVVVGYHIRDNRNIEILGSNTLFEGIGELTGAPGEKVIVEFDTKLPLVEGTYNISTVISTPTVHNRAALFVDYTENAYIFNVLENMECKVWNKVYVSNRVKIMRVGGESSK
ncbi:ABC transporter ATP-binding protein [Paenibacillus alvei]|uniref:ABC transporter ATP-binding protein n=1 Tax=Paenibacillus alvei TaxID=44250 RepID=A0AAP6ZWH9_PAEAL|nr:ABC transporter ATP-binding protein [Paenibacillus alvei]NOJ71314.1 ABC transporter ATP-binding protein [Paenibacillus alvei]